MKAQILYRIIGLFFLMTGWITVQAQNQFEVPGDNFSLEGALEVFKKSGTPEEFERMLNDPETKVNNLDLNGDGYIDYIRVIDRYEGNVHAFILQAIVSERESQDIAVITLEKLANGKAVLQIIGDEDIYGVETIIEPTREVRTYGGTMTTRVVVDVWAWPFVRYVYSPHYTVWVSPWAWHYRPFWWHPWRPIAYYDYYPYWHHYRPYYRVCHTHRIVYVDRIYRPHRTTSVIVHNRYNRQITHYRSRRIDDNGRYHPRSDRSNARQSTAHVRYSANGRIQSDRSTAGRTSTTIGSRTRSAETNGRSSVTPRTDRSYSRESTGTDQRSSGSNVRRSTERSSESTGDRKSSVSRTDRTYSRESTGSNQRSSSPDVQKRSSESSSYRRSAEPSRSTGSYKRESSGSRQQYSTPNVQRSTRSSGSSSYQRSSGSSRSEGSYRSGSSGGSQRSYSNSSSRGSSDRSSGSSSRSSSSSSGRGRR